MNLILQFLNSPEVQTFFVEYIANSYLENIHSKIKEKVITKSLDKAIYEFLKKILKTFCKENNFSYSESTLQDFIKLIGNFKNNIDRKHLINVFQTLFNREIDDTVILQWNHIFLDHITRDENKRLATLIQIENIINLETNFYIQDDINTFLNNNQCEIHYPIESIYNDFFSQINSINQNLPVDLWREICILLYELSLNCYKHGNAKNCYIKMTTNSIYLIDDGFFFDFNNLIKIARNNLSGGSYCYSTFVKEHNDINIKQYQKNGKNIFKISFENPVFNISAKSEVIYIHENFFGNNEYIKSGIVIPNSICKYYFYIFHSQNEIYKGQMGINIEYGIPPSALMSFLETIAYTLRDVKCEFYIFVSPECSFLKNALINYCKFFSDILTFHVVYNKKLLL